MGHDPGKRLRHAGEWAVDEMKVRVESESVAYLVYERYVVNAYKYEKKVKLSWLEKRKGLSLKDKIKNEMILLKQKLESENKNFRERKRLEQSFR
ncbi:hypothetical protein BTO30_12410 [Domibacillus antri]|uniref:Uncharacterized protein n=1 Tax=Domibacillus antri TaxID=1714264 RepID=A0A1Q8Q3H9_9BACI|nr:hypothetical protein [Domibacillus antri]OLN21894.1 hypothetical protein BTO30_12410 [Domibacillus antri]